MEEIAQVYARALFEVATEHDELDLVREQIGEFADALDESRELQMFFFSPYFSTEEKKDGLRKAVTGADESVMNFLELLLENHRMPVDLPRAPRVRPPVAGGQQAPGRPDHERRGARSDGRRARRRRDRCADRA